jgi:hypothetical protein
MDMPAVLEKNSAAAIPGSKFQQIPIPKIKNSADGAKQKKLHMSCACAGPVVFTLFDHPLPRSGDCE